MDTPRSTSEAERTEYRQLSLVIGPREDGERGYRTSAYDGMPEEGEPIATAALAPLDVSLLQRLQPQLWSTQPPCKETLEELGDYLRPFLLQGQVGEVFFQRINEVGGAAGTQLRVRLCLAFDELEGLFWECLRIAEWERARSPRIRSAFAWLNPLLSLGRHPANALQQLVGNPGHARGASYPGAPEMAVLFLRHLHL